MSAPQQGPCPRCGGVFSLNTKLEPPVLVCEDCGWRADIPAQPEYFMMRSWDCPKCQFITIVAGQPIMKCSNCGNPADVTRLIGGPCAS